MSAKKIVLDTENGKGGIIAHYCAIPPSQPPVIAYNIAQYILPTTPFIAIKYWQYLVRAKWPSPPVVGPLWALPSGPLCPLFWVLGHVIARVDPNLGSKDGRFSPISRLSQCHHGGRRRRYEAAVRATSGPSVCPLPRLRLHARPVDVDRPDVLALQFLIRQLPKLGPAPDWALDCSPSGCTRLRSPYNCPPPRSPIRRPYVAC